MELGQYTLEYHPRTTIKGQALTDFVVECSLSELDLEDQLGAAVSSVIDIQSVQTSWTLYMDGSSNSDISGASVILTSLEGFNVQQAIRFQFKMTNNKAEYEAILAGLWLA